MARGWALRVLGCLAAAMVLVTGCSAEPEPKAAAPTTSAKASPALPPLGPADLPMPAAARQMTADGFNAFTRYYIDLINHLDKNLDGTELRKLSQNCETCNRIANDADNDAQKGYSYHGGTITLTWQSPAVLKTDGAENAFSVDQDAYSVLNADGSPVPGLNSQALHDVQGGMSGVWVEDHWVVTNLSFG